MASPFAEAIMQSMVASMDPNVAMQREAMQGYVETQRGQVLVAQAQAVREINECLTRAISENADTSVISAYQKLLAKLVA